MPTGVIINALSVVVGGILGALVGGKLSKDFKDKINMIFGCCSMGMGISSIVLMKNMPAVVFSVIIGTAIGLVIHLGDRVNAGGRAMQKFLSKFIRNTGTEISEEEFQATLTTVIVLFCASGTGIYGAIVSGMTGDHSILIGAGKREIQIPWWVDWQQGSNSKVPGYDPLWIFNHILQQMLPMSDTDGGATISEAIEMDTEMMN